MRQLRDHVKSVKDCNRLQFLLNINPPKFFLFAEVTCNFWKWDKTISQMHQLKYFFLQPPTKNLILISLEKLSAKNFNAFQVKGNF